MGKQKMPKLTGLENLLMNAIWHLSEATVKDVQRHLEAEKPLAYNTVLTVMRQLRDKGVLASKRVGRADVYHALIKQENVAQSSLTELVNRFFSGSARALVSQLMESVDQEELQSIRKDVNDAIAKKRKRTT